MHMESYDEFCSRSLVRLLTKSKVAACGKSSVQQEALSIIRFHGRAVLAPLLSVDQRREMTQYRQRAAQLEADRLRRANLLARVQDIIDSVQVRKGTGEFEGPTSPARSPPKSELMNGFALLPNMSSPPWGARDGEARDADPLAERRSLTLPNGMGEGVEGCEEAEGEECGVHGLSLQTLLRKSRAYLEREHGRRGSWAGGRGRGAPQQAESLSDKENESSGGERGTERRSQRPLTPPMRPPPSEPDLSPDSLLERIPRSLTGSYARLPSPEPSLSPRPHRRRPRPFSAGNILISCPMSAAELSPGKGQEGGEPGAWGAAARDAAPERRSPNCRSSADSPPPSVVALRNSSQSGARLLRGLAAPVSTSAPSPAGPDDTPPGFRQRSNTLDSSAHLAQSGPPLDRSQEGTPRLLGGPAQRAARRRSPPAVLNQSYDIESPSPMLLRPHVTSKPAPGLIRQQSELESSHEGGAVLSPLPLREQNRTSEEVLRRVTALEEARRQMEEEHALQLSLLIAEQEKEQQHLRQELEEREWTLRGQGGDQALSDSLTAAERSPAHSIGCPSVFSPPGVPLPAAHSPAYRRGPSWGAGKLRSRLNQVVFPPELQGALCRLSAVVRGFLTRRLLKTEKLKHLRQTVLDTRTFIQSFQTEAPLKRGSLSAQDFSLQERLRVQLRAALYDVYDVFFVMPLGERLALLQQDRELRTERKLREMNKGRSPRERAVLSAATQRSLDRKKQRVINTPGQGKRSQQKPNNLHINRVLQPNQGLNAPLPGRPLRHGSLSRKNQEERVKRVDNLKKPNLLG